MRVGRFWLVTIDTINGPWHVGSKDNELKWYIVNRETGHSEYIGRVTGHGHNYFDEARDEAKRRNRELGFPND